jgi:hypothetical protein
MYCGTYIKFYICDTILSIGGKRYTFEKINQLVSLRKKGKTIPELMDILHMPKTTIWHYVREVKLSDEIARRLRSQKGGTHKRKLQAWKDADLFAQQLLEKKSSNFVRAVVMLYWAEGHKKDFIFTNTDLKMLQVYMVFLLEIMDIPKNAVRVMVRTSDPIEVHKALLFWSKNLNLPLKNFISSHTNLNKTKTTWGICRIMVSRSSFYHKVMISLITRVQEELLRPCSSMDRTPHS